MTIDRQSSYSMILKTNAGKLAQIKEEIFHIYNQDDRPWVVAYSGGKDSTATLQLVLEAIAENPQKPIHVLYADTKVEPPPVIENASKLLRKVSAWGKKRGFPIHGKILYPKEKDNFFVLMLGKGYLPPTRWFRWCTERLKVRPMKSYIHSLIEEQGACVVVMGMRLKESSNRDSGLKKRGNSKWMPFEGLKGATMYAPILELTVEDVWSYLLDSNPPWGLDNNLLRHLYTGGNTSCSLYCGGIRFGCWVCTVVKKDRCTEGLAQLPGWDWLENLLDYRDLMISLRNDPNNRITRRNNGRTYLGPFDLKTRKFLFHKLKELEAKMDMSFISGDDVKLIRQIWKDEARSVNR